MTENRMRRRLVSRHSRRCRGDHDMKAFCSERSRTRLSRPTIQIGCLWLLLTSIPDAYPLDLRNAVVVTPPNHSRREQRTIAMLIDEVQKRVGLRWNTVNAWPTSAGAVIVVGTIPSL